MYLYVLLNAELCTAIVSGIIAAVILVISLLIVLVLRKRLLIAIALIKESSRYDPKQAHNHQLAVFICRLL